MDGKKLSGLINASSADKKLMKKLLAVLIFGFAAAFNSFSAPTNQPPVSEEQVRSMVEGVQKAVSKGQEQVFDISYESVTNKLLELKPNPAANGWSIPGHEVTSGQFYLCIPEGPQSDVTEKDTSILVTRIGANSTRVQMKTIHMGIIFNSRDRQIEKQRLNELSQLLSNKN